MALTHSCVAWPLSTHPPLTRPLSFPQDGFKLEPIGAEMLPQEPYPVQEPQERPVSMRPKPQRTFLVTGRGSGRVPLPQLCPRRAAGTERRRPRKHMHNCHIPGCGKAIRQDVPPEGSSERLRERVNGDKGFDGTAPPQSAPNVSAIGRARAHAKLKTEPDSAVTGQSG
uniref:Uncharacterized protein n=1 Tax=Knipowitschia caucasica TaxID=637954 RepID=A0AAV2LKW5_KNICA